MFSYSTTPVFRDHCNFTEDELKDLVIMITANIAEAIDDDFVFPDIENLDREVKKEDDNKIKLDFMQALHSIVKSQIKHVYAEQNEGIYILLSQFDNYFTLNYDSFLYLLLLKYRKNISC